MPEGHTLHGLARDLRTAFAGRTVAVTSPQGRFADGAALLNGRKVLDASAWGKHLFLEFDGDAWLHVHLGLIGVFTFEPPGSPPRGAVRVRLATRSHVADLRGPNLCAVITPEQVAGVHARLGPDPLRPGADPDQAWRRTSRSARTVAELLMDQAVLAGVGNVYRSELLYRHRVDPFRPGKEIRPRTWSAMWEDLVHLMPLAMAAGQILTMTDQVDDAVLELDTTGTVTRPERRYYVYKRTGEPCRVCNAKVRTQVVAGRNLFWCGRCQRRR